MSRESILVEIQSLERQKAQQPHMAATYDQQITALCDKLKRLGSFTPRNVV